MFSDAFHRLSPEFETGLGKDVKKAVKKDVNDPFDGVRDWSFARELEQKP